MSKELTVLTCSSVPILRVLRNSLPWRRTPAWPCGLYWGVLWARRLPQRQGAGFPCILTLRAHCPVWLSQMLRGLAVCMRGLLVLSPTRPSVAPRIADPIVLTPYIIWCLTPMATRVFGGTTEAFYASL